MNEELQADLNRIKIVTAYLDSRLEEYRRREESLTWQLNRARRLEKELQDDTDR